MVEVFSEHEVRNIAELIEQQLQDNRGAINEAFAKMGDFNAAIAIKAVPRKGQVEVSIQSTWTKEKFKTRNKLRFNPAQLPLFPD